LFKSAADAATAIKKLNGIALDGKVFIVLLFFLF